MPSFGAEISTGNITENWLFKLTNDNSGFLYFAFSDVTDSGNFYHGVILNKPSIRESINLSNSTSKTSNVSISMPDFTYQGNPISEELFGGSNHYINQVVSVYSKVGSATTQIGSFRLTDISSDGGKINISMASHRPWDFIDFPQTQSPRGNYFPIAYGAFTPNTSTVLSPDFCASMDLYPTTVEQVQNEDFLCLQPKNATDGKLHYYNNSADRFIPLDDVNDDSVVLGDGYINTTNIDLERAYRLRPNSIVESNDYTDYDDNGINTIDTNAASFSTISAVGGVLSRNDRDWESVSEIHTNIAQVHHEIQSYKVGFKFGLTFNINAIGTIGDVITIAISVTDFTTGSFAVVKQYNYTATFLSTGTWDFTSSNIAIAGDQSSSGIIITETAATFLTGNLATDVDGLASNKVIYKAGMTASHDGSLGNKIVSVVAAYDMYDTFIQPQSKIPIRDTDIAKHNSASESIEKINLLYSGADGLTHDITDTAYNGNAITTIHETHLDLLKRFTGLDSSNLSNDIDGWDDGTSSDLMSDRSTWKIRWWELEPTELKKVLEKLQYEGGFIFRYKADGSPQYIHIKDSHTADETLTKADIASISVRPSSFSELLTKIDVNYERHPAENKYMTSQTSTNATARTNWNIQAKENIMKVDLDAYVSPTIPATPSTNPNDDFYTYYDNIFGDIKLIVSGNIVNPKYYNLEVGKVLAFSDMYPIKAFNTSWSGLKFMITGLTRTAGTLKFEAREI